MCLLSVLLLENIAYYSCLLYLNPHHLCCLISVYFLSFGALFCHFILETSHCGHNHTEAGNIAFHKNTLIFAQGPSLVNKWIHFFWRETNTAKSIGVKFIITLCNLKNHDCTQKCTFCFSKKFYLRLTSQHSVSFLLVRLTNMMSSSISISYLWCPNNTA